MTRRSRKQLREIHSPVAAVGIHLDQVFKTTFDTPGKTSFIGTGKPRLLFAVQHADSIIRGGECVGHCAGSIRAVVVNNQQLHGWVVLEEVAHRMLEIQSLVIRGHDYQGVHRCQLYRWLGGA